MLLSLMMQLEMFGGNVPPPNPDSGGIGHGWHSEHYQDDNQLENDWKKRNKRILQDDDDILAVLKMWLKTQ